MTEVDVEKKWKIVEYSDGREADHKQSEITELGERE